MTHPDVRRVASITSTISAMPKTRSQFVGIVLRSVKSSPPATIHTIVATETSARTTSHHMSRWRKRRATGNSMYERKRTMPTWISRRRSVRTIEYAA